MTTLLMLAGAIATGVLAGEVLSLFLPVLLSKTKKLVNSLGNRLRSRFFKEHFEQLVIELGIAYLIAMEDSVGMVHLLSFLNQSTRLLAEANEPGHADGDGRVSYQEVLRQGHKELAARVLKEHRERLSTLEVKRGFMDAQIGYISEDLVVRLESHWELIVEEALLASTFVPQVLKDLIDQQREDRRTASNEPGKNDVAHSAIIARQSTSLQGGES